jgi:transcriptional regulator with XRE-family HTH domain
MKKEPLWKCFICKKICKICKCKAIPAQVRKMRIKKGLGKKELERIMKLPKGLLNRLERGDHDITELNARRFAEYFGGDWTQYLWRKK